MNTLEILEKLHQCPETLAGRLMTMLAKADFDYGYQIKLFLQKGIIPVDVNPIIETYTNAVREIPEGHVATMVSIKQYVAEAATDDGKENVTEQIEDCVGIIVTNQLAGYIWNNFEMPHGTIVFYTKDDTEFIRPLKTTIHRIYGLDISNPTHLTLEDYANTVLKKDPSVKERFLKEMTNLIKADNERKARYHSN